MNARRRLAIIGIVVAIPLFVIGTAGVGTISLDRGVSVPVVGDSEARLGIDVTCDNNATTVATIVTNRFENDIDVTLRSGTATATIIDLGSGDSERVSFPVMEAGTEVTVEATGNGATVTLTRQIPSECYGAD